MDHQFGKVVYSKTEIARRVAQLGAEISAHYPGGDALIVIPLLKGAFIFAADLVREITLETQIEFMAASSYGSGMESSGSVALLKDVDESIAGRHVLLVEDVIDSGTTLGTLIPLLDARSPASLEVCALLDKKKSVLPIQPKWVGFEAPDLFLVGYGLDHAERYRNLPDIVSV